MIISTQLRLYELREQFLMMTRSQNEISIVKRSERVAPAEVIVRPIESIFLRCIDLDFKCWLSIECTVSFGS